MDIALLEDNPSDSGIITNYLQSCGHSCIVFETGQSLIDSLTVESNFSLLVIDWELPDICGDEILRWVRKNLDENVPVIFVTGHDSTEDIVAMLDAGADDYMTKPVNLKELLARITALVRRSKVNVKVKNIVTIEPFTLDFHHRRITKSGKEMNLTPKEFELAGYLLRNIGDLISRNQLLEDIWGYGPEIHTRTIDIHISRIRKKLTLTEENGWKLTSIYHKGYRLDRMPAPEINPQKLG